TETFGNVVLEAMASGLTVISHREGATAEFAHEGTALPVDVRSADALADAVRTLLDDPGRRHRLADAGRAEAASRTWDRIWDDLFAEYDTVLAAHHTQRAPAARVA
ncbi:MAG TPA: glycosyltransferase, partial [Gemmatimonadaceae bacterium]|nr:glycosyltransferase [Gemmatimonadaceae bacterium]